MSKIKTAVSMTLSRHSQGDVVLVIDDHYSSNQILEISMSTHDLAMLITGMSAVKGDAVFNTKSNVAMKRVIKHVTCPKVNANEAQKSVVTQHFIENYCGDWELFNDGLGTQQNGDEHKYIIVRYEPVEHKPENVERFY